MDATLLQLSAQLDQAQADIDTWLASQDGETVAALSTVLQEMFNDPESEALEKIIARLAHHALASAYCRLEHNRNGADL